MKPIWNTDSRSQVALCLITDGNTVKRASRLALVVGSILVLINQGDTISEGMQPDWLKVTLTFAVPYCVSTWTSVLKDLDYIFNRGKQKNDN